MKNLLKYSWMLLVALGLSSCEKLVEGYDEDPNNPTDAPASLMIEGVETANAFLHEGDLARTSGMWSRYFTGSGRQYVSYETYDVTSGDFNDSWTDIYYNVVAQARIVQRKASAAGEKGLAGVAQIYEAHSMGTAVALWGDVPYSEAADAELFPSPKYDSRAEIYASLQNLLDEAITNVDGIGSEYAVITQLGSWKEVAYSLKARYYLHTGEYANAIAAAEMGISSAGNSWSARHFNVGSTNSWNTYYSFLDWYRGGYMTADASYLYGLLKEGNVDYRGNSKTDEAGRLAWFFDDTGACAGYIYGEIVDPNWCDGAFSFDASFPLFTYAENQLILAEAKTRGNQDADALTHLNNVRAYNDATYGASAGAYASYDMADFEVGGMMHNGTSANSSLLEEVLEEKYVSMCGQIEGFTDLRRTDNLIGVPPTKGTTIPERFLYPQSEINSNPSTPSPIPGLFDPIQ